MVPLAGKPLIKWAQEAASASGVIDDLVLSTDDNEIAHLGSEMGLEVPFMRPPELGRDPAGVEQVALHALKQLSARGRRYSEIVILLPTSPLRTAADIRDAFELFRRCGAMNVMSVSASEHNPFNAMRFVSDEVIAPAFPEFTRMPTAQLPKTYRPNGAVHVLDVRAFERNRSYLAEPIYAYVMQRENGLDIDTAEDLAYAEFVMSLRQQAQSDSVGENEDKRP